MRDINQAERLLSFFTSSDSAAGIVGDLSEERTQHGSLWFWRQVLGTILSLCRGALFESPVVVLLLVALGLALSVVGSAVVTGVAIRQFIDPPGRGTSALQVFLMLALLGWPMRLIAGATMVAAAPRLGMAACVFVAGLQVILSIGVVVFTINRPYLSTFWWLGQLPDLAYPVLLLTGGAMFKHLWNARTLRSAQ